MIPGLSSGSGNVYGNVAASWAASWSGAATGAATAPASTPGSILTPSQIAQQKLKAAALASKASAPQHPDIYRAGEDDDEYSPESHIDEGEAEGTNTTPPIDDDIYEPELPAEADEDHSYPVDNGNEDDDMYDPDAYAPEENISADVSPRSFDTDGRVSDFEPATGANPMPTSGGALDSDNLVSKPSAAQDDDISLIEARKKAQAAILRLWPLEVRYQQYIEEGIEETVIKQLFCDLGLDTSSGCPQTSKQKSPIAKSTTSQQDSPSVVGSMSGPSATAASQTAPPSITPATTTKASPTQAVETAAKASINAEERKDRIARLLAMKKAARSQTVAPLVTTPGQSLSQDGSRLAHNQIASLPPKPPTINQTALSSHEALRKHKMEVLATMRPKRISTTSKADDPSPVSTVAEPTPVDTPTPKPASTLASNSPPRNAPTGPRAFTLATQPTSIPNRTRPTAPNVTIPSSVLQPVSRPVPQQMSFVIDVSSDEEEDSHPAQNDRLYELPSTSNSSKVLSLNGTPVNGSVKQGKQVAELDRDIDQLKRKIAEMEARKSTSSSGTPISQQQQKQAPPSLPLPSFTTRPPPAIPQIGLSKIKKPQPASKKAKKKTLARKRAAKKLPIVEAMLAKKVARLQSVNLEAMKLLKEIEDAQREKLRLEQETKEEADDSDSAEENDGRIPKIMVPETPAIPILGKRKDVSPAQASPASVSQQSRGQNGLPPKPPTPSVTIKSTAPLVNTALPTSQQTETIADSTSSEDKSSDEGLENYDITDSPSAKRARISTTKPSPKSVNTSPTPLTDAEDDLPMDESNSDVSDTSSSEESDQSDDEEREEKGKSDTDTDPSHVVDETLTSQRASLKKGSSPPHVPIWKQKTQQKQQEQAITQSQPSTATTDNDSDQELNGDALPIVTSRPKFAAEISDVFDTVHNPTYPDAFVPYESIYKGNAYYCFHPSFDGDVATTLRSLTYSNNIDPNWAFCTDDLDDGGCSKGTDCEWQHLSNIGIGGHADRRRFIDGLRQVLIDIKVRDVKDFDLISKAILDYRRNFLGDASKIRFMDVDI
ncbi:hypothetical protein HOO65_030461 [Ceratocystis lukuohia]|uniref:C3H1-type domain-containing protein n=1 Tax=Ceratocystis lukuohia TaxID=2019550 RepID=A0ABR4ML18_9PEZI